MKYDMEANLSRKFIKESNDRSKAYGIRRNQVTSNKVLNDRELNDLIKENQELIYVANPFIEQLYDFVKKIKLHSNTQRRQGMYPEHNRKQRDAEKGL